MTDRYKIILTDYKRPRDFTSAAGILGRFVKTNNPLTVTDKERASGMHVLGGTGTGKSTVAQLVAREDIKNGHGLLFVDTDGDSINKLLPHIPTGRMKDVILL